MHLDPRIGPIRPIEYAILHRTRNAGEVVAHYLDEPVYQTVIDEFDRRYRYGGLAKRLPNGEFDFKALGRGEFILLPGLVYVAESDRRR
jgi:hypothetical protein